MDKVRLICVTIFMVFYIIKYVMRVKISADEGLGFAGFLGSTLYYAFGVVLLYIGGFFDCYFNN